MTNHMTLKRAVLCTALSLCIAGAAHAQSNATGSIFGNAEPGTTIVIYNSGTGQSRTVTADANGRYQAPSLALGSYKVELKKDGRTIATHDDVAVNLGSASQVSFGASGGDATTLDSITVTGSNSPSIDVSSTDIRSVFTSEQIEKMPIGRSINAVALLAPGVVAGDSRYNGVASFGGASVTENAYYINGYAVTNPLTGLGSTTLPFNGLDQMQVLTSGYGAEFGRATGGVINMVTKRGSNDWRFGGQAIWNPNADHRRNIYVPKVGLALDGQLYQNLHDYKDESVSYGAYVSGPIVKDRLFFYASGEFQDRSVETYGARAGSTTNYGEFEYDVPRWLAKIDWNITDNQTLELTAVSDVSKRTEYLYPYAYTQAVANSNNAATGESNAPFQRGKVRMGGGDYKDGGELYIGKYTGYLTENLTLTALYGKQKQEHTRTPWGYDAGIVPVRGTPFAGGNALSFGSLTQLAYPDAFDETDGGRLDLIWTVGDHSLRFGYDEQNSESREGTVTAGNAGYYWNYGYGAADTALQGGGGMIIPANGRYVSKVVYNNGGQFKTEQYAYYLEDRWQVSDKVLLSLGVRNENFTNFNGDGIAYLDGKDQWAPRIGVTWDVFGDSSLKVFGNVGRYHLTVPNTVAQRGASGSTFTNEYFSYTGIDPNTGLPLNTSLISPNGPYSSNSEYGQSPNPNAVAASDLKPYFQDELVLGFEKQISNKLFGGMRYVYRELGSMIDDICDPRGAIAWGVANGYDNVFDSAGNKAGDVEFDGMDTEAARLWTNNTSGCRMGNPGVTNTWVLYDDAGNPHNAKFNGGFPKMVRKYHSVDLFIEHPFADDWYYKLDYTWSHNYGNGEGMTNSDIGQDVAQAAQTQSWDHVEQTEGGYGNLPNDRRHQFKAFGYYQLNDEWRFSGTFVAYSGRPKNCTGIYNGVNANDDFATENVLYNGPYYWFCNGEASPRGSRGTMPWTTRMDVGVNYAPSFVAGNKLQFSFDIFNVLNRRVAQNIVEYGENGGIGVPYQLTGRVISYSAPRSMRFSIRYDY
ncbi:TonB-dependent receptor [uncultured Stenotrophomonas sp.]|uniref:TonB-dependent receptor n=1 Tax=uncultured Stenotrophomonas sp. TaxID=165438 RepID=UPI0025F74DD1|nr:TonB-dependent receptor [uncultured Stenotrophomonas sp.]